ETDAGPGLLALSARSRPALRALAQKYHDFLTAAAGSQETAFADICFTAATGRSHFQHRLALVAGDAATAVRSLEAFLGDETSARLVSGSSAPGHRPRIGFVFSGQGCQWDGMGRQLLQREAVFRQTLEACDAIFRPLAGWSLLAELEREQPRWQDTSRFQPVLFALQLGLTALWKSWGIEPAAVAGHSVGELAAACTAGSLSLEDALQLVWHRSRLMHTASGKGKMASIEASAAELEPLLQPYAQVLAIAALNGPQTTVVAGEIAALNALLATADRQGFSHALLPVDYAFHSPQMDSCKGELREAISEIRHSPPGIPFVSTVTGKSADLSGLGPDYWVRNLREPVQLSAAITSLSELGVELFLEIGPHPVLAKGIFECLHYSQLEGSIVGSLRRGKDERESLLQSLASLYAQGADPAWGCLLSGRRLALPTYAWQRERYWVEASTRLSPAADSGSHGILGRRLPVAWPVFESRLSPTRPGQQASEPFVCLAWCLEMLRAGAETVRGRKAFATGPLRLGRGLDITVEQTLQLSLLPLKGGALHCGLSCLQEQEHRADPHWNSLLETELRPAANGFISPADTLPWPGALEAMAAGQWYLLPETFVTADRAPVLSLLEAVCRTLKQALPEASLADDETLWLPLALAKLLYRPSGADRPVQAWVRLLTDIDPEQLQPLAEIAFDLRLGQDDGQIQLAIDGLQWRSIARRLLERERFQDWLYETVWEPAQTPFAAEAASETPSLWLLAGARTPLAQQLEARLSQEHQAWEWLDPAGSEAKLYTRLNSLAADDLRAIIYFCPRFCPGSDYLASSNALLTLVQALAKNNHSRPLYLLTQGSQQESDALETDTLDPAAAVVWGFGQVIALEHPALQAIRIDLPAQPEAADLENLVQDLADAGGENQIRYNNQRREVARLRPYRLPPAPDFSMAIRADGCYLISGGLGALGLLTAERLIQRGARHLVLSSRRPPGPEVKALIASWPEAEVFIVQADVSQPADVERLFAQIAGLPPLRGVIHAAGVLDDGIILQQSPERFERVLQAKVAG
ncbi:MAG: SDR family NAD(P)-dependent oxidoreductase, partial [Candidatus Sericytochromatia bacterium]